MQPTREQVLEWAKAEGLWFDDRWIFYTPKRPSLPEPEADAFVSAMNAAYAAGRAQGLKEAVDSCINVAHKQSTLGRAFAASDCVRSIEQLKGKQ